MTFRIDKHESRAPLWTRIEAEMHRRVAELRAENDSPNNTEADTQLIRGQIAELKIMLAWTQDPPPLVQDATGY